MKKATLSFTAILLFVSIPDLSIAQANNNTSYKEGGACKILSGANTGKTGTYDADGWCCTGANGTGSCTDCTPEPGGKSRCADAITKQIKLDYVINGNWTVMNDQSGKASAISVTNNTLKVNMSSFGRPEARGVLIDKNTIRLVFPDNKLSIFGKITSPTRIVWSNGTIWVKKSSRIN
jgi:hypothetical protein